MDIFEIILCGCRVEKVSRADERTVWVRQPQVKATLPTLLMFAVSSGKGRREAPWDLGSAASAA